MFALLILLIGKRKLKIFKRNFTKLQNLCIKYSLFISSSHEIRKPCPSLEEFGDLVTKCHLHNIKPYGQDEILADKGSYKWDLCGPIKFILNDFHPNSIIKTRITVIN